jgi:beta-lactamase regulating signal transducer with metallopeptidase domain
MTGLILTAVLNSLWQSAALALAAWVALKLLPKINAATRYAVWWSVLAAMLLLPVAPRSFEWFAGTSEPAAAPLSVITEAPLADARGSVDLIPAHPAPLELHSGAWTASILATWAIVFLLRAGYIVRSYAYLRGIKRRAHRATREQRLAFDCWRMSCGIDRPVQLLISSEIASPMAAGFLHPAVIVPAPLLDEFTEPELDHVLLHELAHVARHDDWTNLAARIADAAFGLHPVAAWILKRIDREREIACDDWVVSMTGDARPYAASLTRLFELCSAQRRHVLATGMADRASHLGERIEMLLRRGREFVPGASLGRVAASVAVLLALVLAGAQAPQWVAFAQDRLALVPPEPPDPPEPPEPPQAPQPPQPPASVRAPQPPRAPDPPPAPQAPQAPQPPQPPQPPAQAARGGSLLAALVAAGYGDLSVDEIIELANSGVRPEFLTAVGQSGWGKLSARQLIELSNHGVSAGYLRGMKEAGLKDLSLQDVMEMSNHGVRPDFFKEVHALGFGPYNARQAIEFANSGVRPELFRALKSYNFTNLEPRDIIELANNGVRESDLRAAKEYGPNLTLKQILRLKQAGVI